MTEENFWEDCEHNCYYLNTNDGSPILLCELTEDEEGYADYCLEDECNRRDDFE